MSFYKLKVKKISPLFCSIQKRFTKTFRSWSTFSRIISLGIFGLGIGCYIQRDKNFPFLEKNVKFSRENKKAVYDLINNFVLLMRARFSKNLNVLLELAEHQRFHIRNLAIENIIQTSWEDEDLRLIENTSSNHTKVLISLKKETDEKVFVIHKFFNDNFKFLLYQFYQHRVKSSILDKPLKEFMKENLRNIYLSDNYCRYLRNRALSEKWLSEEQQSWWGFSESSCEKIIELEDDGQFYAMYLDTFCSICQTSDYTKFMEHNGLTVLKRILEENDNDLLLKTKIAKILAVLSVHKDTHDTLSKHGFINFFADWMRSSDLSLSSYASKSLWNIYDPTNTYADGVYLYSPFFWQDSEPDLDIIFVHGLKGGPFRTWRQKDFPRSEVKMNKCMCWPKEWLSKDIQNCRILGVEYATKLSDWNAQNQQPLPLTAKNLASKLKEAGVGKRPIIWVGHSMGGLLIKYMLEDSHLVEKSHGFIFYSVPHFGCPLASLSNNRLASIFNPSLEVRELQEGNQKLKKLNENFIEVIKRRELPVFSFAEGSASQFPLGIKRIIVPETYAYPGIGRLKVMSNLNHLDICKPEDPQSELYIETKNFIKKYGVKCKDSSFQMNEQYFSITRFVCVD